MGMLNRNNVKKVLTNECLLRGINGAYVEDACEHVDNLMVDGGSAIDSLISGVQIAEKLQAKESGSNSQHINF
jgi:hypothetical protein